MSGSPWILAARPGTLSASLAPVAVGAAIAGREPSFDGPAALAALLGAVCIQLGTNFANDVYDFRQGADTAARLGPTRAVAAGLLGAEVMERAMVGAFLLATAAGLYLTLRAGPVVVVIGVASIAAGVGYTRGRSSLAYVGLGDPFVLLFFGPVAVAGTTFVASGVVSGTAVLAGLAVGSVATAVLVVNNLRDRDTDALAGKRTLAVRFGRDASIAEYAGLLGLAILTPPALVMSGVLGAAALLPVVTLPVAVYLVRQLARVDGRALNGVLARTALLLAVYGATFALGILSA